MSNAVVKASQLAVMAATLILNVASYIVDLVNDDSNPPLESFSSQAKAKFDIWAAGQALFVITENKKLIDEGEEVWAH